MRSTLIFIVFLLTVVVVSCSPGMPATQDTNLATAPVNLPGVATAIPAGVSVPALQAESSSQPVLDSTNCANAEANKLGAAIAGDYAFTTTEQVMGWFCNGAEFEDILVALETADLTGSSAEEMLQMLAAGMTWEEIWQVVGLTD